MNLARLQIQAVLLVKARLIEIPYQFANTEIHITYTRLRLWLEMSFDENCLRYKFH